MYINKTLREYLDDLSAKKPAPGGGSAAAVAGALGASLVMMVAAYTLGKEKYKHFEHDAEEAFQRAKLLKEGFIKLIDEDVLVYNKIAHAEIKTEDLYKEACKVPLEVMWFALEGMEVCMNFVDRSNPNLITDIGVAVELFESAYFGARLNVDINLKSIKQDEYYGVNIRKNLEPEMKNLEYMKRNVLERMERIMR